MVPPGRSRPARGRRSGRRNERAVEVVSWNTTLTMCGAVCRVRLLVVEPREVGRLLLAGTAPTGEEVDHDVVTPKRGQGTGAPVRRSVPRERRRGLAEQRALHGRRLLGSAGGQHDTDDDEDASTPPATQRIGWRRRAAPSCPACGRGTGPRARPPAPAPRLVPLRVRDAGSPASVGDQGRRRRRRIGGASARARARARAAPPIPMSRPPAHSHATNGSMTTPMATEPAGRLLMAWFPDVEPESADGVEGQVDVAEEPRVDGRRPDHRQRAAEAGGRRRERRRRRP